MIFTERESYSENAAADEKKLAAKYIFIREKILKNYEKGKKNYRSAKIAATVIFLLFSVIAFFSGISSSSEMQWLTVWIIAVFFNVTVFLLGDYVKYLVEDKVIPYLKDNNAVEYGEYDIFLEDGDTENEEDDD